MKDAGSVPCSTTTIEAPTVLSWGFFSSDSDKISAPVRPAACEVCDPPCEPCAPTTASCARWRGCRRAPQSGGTARLARRRHRCPSHGPLRLTPLPRLMRSSQHHQPTRDVKMANCTVFRSTAAAFVAVIAGTSLAWAQPSSSPPVRQVELVVPRVAAEALSPVRLESVRVTAELVGSVAKSTVELSVHTRVRHQPT